MVISQSLATASHLTLFLQSSKSSYSHPVVHMKIQQIVRFVGCRLIICSGLIVITAWVSWVYLGLRVHMKICQNSPIFWAVLGLMDSWKLKGTKRVSFATWTIRLPLARVVQNFDQQVQVLYCLFNCRLHYRRTLHQMSLSYKYTR